MARKYGPITAEAFAPTRDGKLADADTLTPEQRRTLATKLAVRLLEEAFAGKGYTFFPAENPPPTKSGTAI